MNDKVKRHQAIVKFLLGKPVSEPASLRDIAAHLKLVGLGTGGRNLRVDLNDLCGEWMAEKVSEVENGQTPEYKAGRNAKAPPMEIEDALIWTIAEAASRLALPTTLRELIEPALKRARAKITGVHPSNEPEVGWLDRVRTHPVHMATVPPAIDAKVLKAVENALFNDCVIEVEYLKSLPNSKDSTAPEKGCYKLHPLGLVQRGKRLYLVAEDATKRSADSKTLPIKNFVMHRVLSARATHERFDRPSAWTLDAYLEAGRLDFTQAPGGKPEPITLKARVTANLRQRLLEEPLNDTQQLGELDGTGWADFSVDVLDTWALHWWVFTQHFDMVVTAPTDLAQHFADTYSKAAQQYAQAGFAATKPRAKSSPQAVPKEPAEV